MYFYTYKITNLINGKFYIGVHKTKNINDGYMGSGSYLNRSKLKYGIENFKKDILMYHESESEMFEIESLIVDQEFIGRKDTYNLKLGGHGGFDHLNSDSRIKKNNSMKGGMATSAKLKSDPIFADNFKSGLRNWAKSRWASKDNRDKASAAKKKFISENPDVVIFQPTSPETRQKINAKFIEIEHQKGEKNSQFGTMWIHSLSERRNIKISKSDPIPDGWIKGRKMKF